MSKLKKILKILVFILLFLLVVAYGVIYYFSTPKSTEQLIEDFAEKDTKVFITTKKFQEFDYRVLTFQKKIDTTLPTLVFVHGSIGSASDFKKYLSDKDIQHNANLIAYDRVGYGVFKTGEVKESIEFEKNLLESLINNIDSQKVILVGYSYGGPIVLASNKKYKKIVLLAPAVISKVEPMPWALNLYKWETTRWLMPKAWQAASKEKISHKKDLLHFEGLWNNNPSKIICIHGNNDWIVPYENSTILKEKIAPNKFELITLDGAGHDLVWSNFNEIRDILLQQLN